MIKFPDTVDLETRVKIARMLYDKDVTIQNLETDIANLESHNKRLLNELNLLKTYGKEYDLLDVNYPKDFGQGYELSDFPDGSFIKDGFFVIKRN